ncbi:CzcE family metal-binding protein [Oryzomicrobium sp.]|uniref:CzcE family metal-binding protein n=1 Tax=Oryzomicrobium sp. TaxID=1911578 RepID=UPI0025D38479|nr:CzcE family metal-binding protein [Oryzomicrobium sp.]MCE1243655.1 CzcE family metal-binding protein [Oryzomicrobium sp.]
MKTQTTKYLVAAIFAIGGTTNALAHEDSSEAGTFHWLSHVGEQSAQAPANQQQPEGYSVSAPANRVVTVTDDTKYLNATRLETVEIRVGEKSVTWFFDTLGLQVFPLSKIISGAESVTVYVAENPAYQGG